MYIGSPPIVQIRDKTWQDPGGDVRPPHCRTASSALAESTVLVSSSITTNEARVIATHSCREIRASQTVALAECMSYYSQ